MRRYHLGLACKEMTGLLCATIRCDVATLAVAKQWQVSCFIESTWVVGGVAAGGQRILASAAFSEIKIGNASRVE